MLVHARKSDSEKDSNSVNNQTVTAEGPKRVFVDATYTICSGKSSGIERVVRNLTNEFRALEKHSQIAEAAVVVNVDGRFYKLDTASEQSAERVAAMQSNVLSCLSPSYTRLAQSACSLTGSQQLAHWLLPKPGHLGMFKLNYRKRQRKCLQNISRVCQPVTAGEGDLIVLPDAYWTSNLRNSVWPAAQEAREQGAKVATLVYDLIPITHPQFVGQKRCNSFRDYLLEAVDSSDIMVAISKTVRRELDEYLANIINLDEIPHTASFRLGGEFCPTPGKPRDDLRNLFDSEQAPFLMVGAFDPRKNHHFLLDAFDQIWNDGGDANLCLVGRFGARCGDVAERIQKHRLLNQRLFVFDDVSDSELHYCYSNARAVIFPSIVEGFGLPIVEALAFGKTVFASNTAVHREVGGDSCSYFSLSAPSDLANQIVKHAAQDHSAKSLPPSLSQFTWNESALDLLHKCQLLFSTADQPENRAA